MLTGRTLSAEEGHLAGVTQYLVEDGKGLEKAMELAARAAVQHADHQFRRAARAAAHLRERSVERAPDRSLMAAIAEISPEAKGRLKDFLEKRAAKVLRQE